MVKENIFKCHPCYFACKWIHTTVPIYRERQWYDLHKCCVCCADLGLVLCPVLWSVSWTLRWILEGWSKRVGCLNHYGFCPSTRTAGSNPILRWLPYGNSLFEKQRREQKLELRDLLLHSVVSVSFHTRNIEYVWFKTFTKKMSIFFKKESTCLSHPTPAHNATLDDEYIPFGNS